MSDLSPRGAELLDFSNVIQTLFKRQDVHEYNWHQDSLGRTSMIDFILLSSDLQPYVSSTRVKRGAELVRWQRRMPRRPSRPKQVVRVFWELAKEPVRMVCNFHPWQTFNRDPGVVGDILGGLIHEALNLCVDFYIKHANTKNLLRICEHIRPSRSY